MSFQERPKPLPFLPTYPKNTGQISFADILMVMEVLERQDQAQYVGRFVVIGRKSLRQQLSFFLKNMGYLKFLYKKTSMAIHSSIQSNIPITQLEKSSKSSILQILSTYQENLKSLNPLYDINSHEPSILLRMKDMLNLCEMKHKNYKIKNLQGNK